MNSCTLILHVNFKFNSVFNFVKSINILLLARFHRIKICEYTRKIILHNFTLIWICHAVIESPTKTGIVNYCWTFLVIDDDAWTENHVLQRSHYLMKTFFGYTDIFVGWPHMLKHHRQGKLNESIPLTLFSYLSQVAIVLGKKDSNLGQHKADEWSANADVSMYRSPYKNDFLEFVLTFSSIARRVLFIFLVWFALWELNDPITAVL